MTVQTARPATWLDPADCRLEDLLAIVDVRTDEASYPHASGVQQNVLFYDADDITALPPAGRREVQAELVHAFAQGPGIVVFRGAFQPGQVDAASDRFRDLIAEQHAAGTVVGDHFAKPGANDRVWNALEKLAVLDPATFVDYYANEVLALVSCAWLGPGYQVTSQVNVVNPGGEGQTVHRDYHLGFQSPETSAAYPAHVHHLSPVLTLQGAVAHCDMPVESGPTLYLPHSQKYEHGYLAYWREDFQAHFVRHHVQLPLAKGDAVFFNPALFHAAGTNRSSDILRMANLLQISSAFGRAMESVDRQRVSEAVYPALLAAKQAGVADSLLHNAIAASAEGYSFPTNLDRDQPVGGMAPPTQADIVREALAAQAEPAEVVRRLAAQQQATRSH